MLLKNMTIKVVNEVKTGVSETTGNAWKGMSVILALPDGEHEARFYASLRNEWVTRFHEMGLKVGDRVDVELAFLTESYRGYISNKVYVKGIARANGAPSACGDAAPGAVPVPHITPNVNYPNF